MVLQEAFQPSMGMDKVAYSWHLQDTLQSVHGNAFSSTSAVAINSISEAIAKDADT